jgi:glycosyltransferase involved in cell wall biosynthesis
MKIAFIVQRCGKEIIGGAEGMFLNLATRLSKYYEIDILTTCALDYVTWKNYYQPGISYIDKVCIRRFKTDFTRNISEFNSFSDKVLTSFHSNEDELLWMKLQGPYSSELLEFLKNNENNYDLFIFGPYLYATTFYGLPIVASKSILVPQAHDELPLKLSIYDRIFQNSKGIIFQTEEEQKLVEHRFDLSGTIKKLIGQGVEKPRDIGSIRYTKLNLTFPYLFYMGRIDQSKGCDQLIDYFTKYKQKNKGNTKLLLAGVKVYEFEKNQDVIYLGILSEDEKSFVLKNMIAFIMSSRYESFSIATMEAWLCKKPVIVNAKSEVLKGHCEKSNGGLYYNNYEEFVECIDLLLSDKDLSEQLGNNGYDYVTKNYSWDRIVEEYREFINSISKQ